MRVELTWPEMIIGALVAILRQVSNVKRGRSPAHGAGTARDWQIAIEGCLGEMAVAKALQKYWCGNIGNLGAGDVGDYEVRTTALSDLILHEPGKDKPDSIYICASGRNGTYVLLGWIVGRDGMRPEWFQDKYSNGRPAYFVPQRALRPVYELPEIKDRSVRGGRETS